MPQQSFEVAVKAQIALFTRPDTKGDPVTYLAPPPGQIRGALKTILHKSMLEVVPREVHVLKPVQTIAVPQYKHWDLAFAPNARGKGVPSTAHPYGSLYLWDVAYRILFDAYAPERRLLDRLERNIREGAFYSPPYLGTRECLARFCLPDNTPPNSGVNLTLDCVPLNNNGKFGTLHVVRGVLKYPDNIREILADRRRDGSEEDEA